ncbi:hypothetical protein OIU84_022003 [Salix udensis]|uniref:ADP-ribosyl cyclase/cyclic ADP-ribose hydrolase n=1 Tax=Salix udensis TaxID=889485 RepID=A0AAD6NND4_9ROSI|nr:hypothetical protein OIU84_022003 [Salix udensis]
MADLQRSFLSQLLGQEILKMGSLSFRDTFVRDRLRRKKVFIVLDDVDDLMLLKDWEVLLPRLHRPLGPGSKVLLTSRDKQVLTNVVDETYEVERLSYEEALQLFISKALKNCISTTDHRCLIEMIPHHVQGNPLALVVLGSSLYGKSTEEWYSALNKVALNPRIENVLRISYDGLDTEQQSIFLVIAHFFRRFEQEQAIRILDVIYCRRVIYDINTLIDMCLITTSDNKLEIHDLLQEMAFSIVRAESKSPGKRGRLCHLPDVIHAMEENKGTEEIQGIYVDISKLSRQIQLKPNAFAMMDDLRLLKFFSSHFSEDNKDKILLPSTGLYYLSNKLIYFHWEGFPSRSLPQRFCAEHLVELNLRRSKVEKLWTGVQDIGNLRNIWNAYHRATLINQRYALDCESLETTMISTITLGNLSDALNFVNCFNLDQKPLIEAMHLKILSGEKIGHDIIRMVLPGSEIPGEKIEHDIIQMLLKGSTEFLEEKIEHYTIQMVLPGSEIPEWFGYKGIGSSLTMQLPSNCHQLKGIAFCLVFLLPLPYSYNIFNESVWFRIDLDCHVKSKKGDGHHMFQHVLYYDELNFLKIGASDHMFLHYELGFVDHFRKYSGNAVTFKFYNESDGIRMPCMLKSCGLYLHFDENPHADTLFVENIPYKRRKMRER